MVKAREQSKRLNYTDPFKIDQINFSRRREGCWGWVDRVGFVGIVGARHHTVDSLTNRAEQIQILRTYKGVIE